jgi:hypothetical protein
MYHKVNKKNSTWVPAKITIKINHAIFFCNYEKEMFRTMIETAQVAFNQQTQLLIVLLSP